MPIPHRNPRAEVSIFRFVRLEVDEVEAVNIAARRAVRSAEDDGVSSSGQIKCTRRWLTAILIPCCGRCESERNFIAAIDYDIERAGGAAAIGVAEIKVNPRRLGEGEIPCNGDICSLTSRKIRIASARITLVRTAECDSATLHGTFRLV